MSDARLDQLLAHARKETDEFIKRVESIQRRLNINPDDESPAQRDLIPFLLYREIIRLEDEVDAGRI